MPLQPGDIFAEVYECEGEITFVPMEGMRPGEIGRRYKYCGIFRYSDGKSIVQIEDSDCLSAMERALPIFCRYLSKKLRVRHTYIA